MKPLFSINGLLRTLTAVMVLGLVVTFAIEALHAWNQRSTARQVVEVTVISRDLFLALQNLDSERAIVEDALDGADAASPDMQRAIAKARSMSNAALEAAEARIAAGSIRARDEAVASLSGGQDRLDRIRKTVDAALAKAKSDRPQELARSWTRAVDDLIDPINALSARLVADINRSDPLVIGLMDVKQLAWVVRDAAESDGRMIGAAIVGSNGLPADQQRQLAVLQGRREAAWKVIRAKVEEPGMPAALKEAVANAQQVYFTKLDETRKKVVADLVSGQAPQLSAAEWRLNVAAPGLNSLVGVANTAFDVTEQYAAGQADNARFDLTLKLGLTLLFLGVGVYALSFVIGRITGPIAAITETTRAVAEGDLRRVILYQDRSDEIGDLARALAVFRDNALAKLRIEAAQRQEQEKKEQRQRLVEQHVAGFDSSIRALLDALSKAAGEMRSTSESMSATAEQTGRQAVAVSDAATHASGNVETVATATEELAASVSEIGRQVNHAAQIANQAVSETRNTDGTVQGLSEAAQRIGEVVQLINDIAAQTNLLALNATIEAARAGDAGKGFAVVASEVKSLATQTGKATDDIAAQVTAIQEATQGAVGAIKSVGHIIQQVSEISATIASAVEEQSATTKEITRNTQEAARGTQAVSVNIAGVSQGAGATGKAADHVLHAAGELGRTADKLRAEVDSFLSRIRAA
jgi:methyl-accepting chemotaxis protein